MRTEAGRLRIGWRLLLFVVVTVVVAGLLGMVLPDSLVSGSAGILGGSVVAGALLLAMDGRQPAALGFYLGRASVVETLLGLALGTGIALLVVLALAAVGGVRWTAQDGSVVDWLAAGLGALGFLAIPAAAEEAVVRGYPLQAVAERWGPVAALVSTSILFGAMHRANPNVTWIGTANVAAAGFFLGVVYLRTASLWWATGAHLGWNWTTGYVADVPVSGLEILDAPLYEGVMRGPAWLGGGGFGPEGSVVATVLLCGATAWCWRTKWLRPSEAARSARPLAILGEAGS